MSTLSTEERLALLLSVLGPDAVNAALKKMNPTRSNFIKNLLDEYKTVPPSEEEIEFIIRDFSRYFSFAMKTLGPEIHQASTALRIAKRKKLKQLVGLDIPFLGQIENLTILTLENGTHTSLIEDMIFQ